MEDKMKEFMQNNDFDIYEPHSGHEDRFLKKLQQPTNKKNKTLSWKWLSVAASVVLLIGFYLGSNFQDQQPIQLRDISPEMNETQMFFVNTINQELREIEKYRNVNTESIIEDALDEIEELEDQYKSFKDDLNAKGNQRQIIQAMITNYQQRLAVLQNLLDQLEWLRNPQNQNNFDETI